MSLVNRDLKIYTELDSLFDYRRGLLQWLVTEGEEDLDKRKEKGDDLWELHFKRNYAERRMDSFEYPFFNIDRTKFKELYKERSLKHWIMYYPSNLKDTLLSCILDLESLDDRPLSISTVTVFVNTSPYELDEELEQQLIESCTQSFGNIVKVKLIKKDPKSLDAKYFGQYDYVFKYNLINDEDSSVFIDSVPEYPNPNTTYIVPNVLVKEGKNLNPEADPGDIIFAFSVTVATAVKLVPMPKEIYDYSD